MAAYRVYRASFPFVAREASELTISEGDAVIVYEKPSGGWPDPKKWMNGTNSNTGETGEFPGTYCMFVEEVAPAPPPVAERSPAHLPAAPPPDEENAPPVPPRRPKSSLGERGREEKSSYAFFRGGVVWWVGGWKLLCVV